MGLFKFVKNAGAKLFKKKQAQVETEEEKSTNAFELMTELSKYGLKVHDADIRIDDDRVFIGGEVDTTETKEKVILTVGNVEGVAEVHDNLIVREDEVPEAQFHTVEKGEYLSLISKKYYGDPMKYKVIFEANKPMLTDPDKIYPGQVLRIPALEAQA